MISSTQIKANAPVFCSDNVKLAVVDHMEGSDHLKLKKDVNGQHHFIPLSWVINVDHKVHLDRCGADAKSGWLTSSPAKSEKSYDEKDAKDRAANEGMNSAPS